MKKDPTEYTAGEHKFANLVAAVKAGSEADKRITEQLKSIMGARI